MERSHETYRLLKRKNLIVEAVRNCKVVEGLFPSVCIFSSLLICVAQYEREQKCHHILSFLQASEDDQ